MTADTILAVDLGTYKSAARASDRPTAHRRWPVRRA
jgi:hypothetical protein